MDRVGIELLLRPLLGPVTVVSATDVNNGRGIFSDVTRVTLHAPPQGIPDHVVLKRPTAGPNGEISVASGATSREAFAYRHLLPDSVIAHPRCFASDDEGHFVLEDLSSARFVDQLDGASADDSLRVVQALGAFHRDGAKQSLPPVLASSPLDTVDPARFEIGFSEINTTWTPDLSPIAQSAFEQLFERSELARTALKSLGPTTLTHGDPRIDNIAFVDDQPVFFDWQQVGAQAGVLDLAWYMATSMTTDTRNAAMETLSASYAEAADRTPETVSDQLRIAVLYPGLMSLLLATRRAESDRSRQFIATSLNRIGCMLHDLEAPEAF